MSSSHQEEEDWSRIQSTLWPTFCHSSPPFSGHQSQASPEKGMYAPLSPCPSSLGSGRICPNPSWRSDDQVAPSWLEKLSPQNKILQAQFAAMCIHQKLTNTTNIDRDLLMTRYNFLILPKSKFHISKSPSSLSCHATYKRLVEITKGKDDSSWLAMIECSSCMRDTSLDKVIGMIEPVGLLLWEITSLKPYKHFIKSYKIFYYMLM